MAANLIIEETHDWQTTWNVAHHASVFDRICDDNWTKKPMSELKEIVRGIVENSANHVLLVRKDGDPAGCFICYQTTPGEFEVHTMMTNRCRGAEAIRAGRLGTGYMLALPDVKRLFSYCPANLPESYLFARMCGWHKGGEAPMKWLKYGVEYPMRIVEISPGQNLCR